MIGHTSITNFTNSLCPKCFADSDVGRFSPIDEVERMLDIDFVPLPCHSDCISMTYAYVNGNKVNPLPRYIDVKAYLDVIGNKINIVIIAFIDAWNFDVRSAKNAVSTMSCLMARSSRSTPTIPCIDRSICIERASRKCL